VKSAFIASAAVGLVASLAAPQPRPSYGERPGVAIRGHGFAAR
jgi:hypothetical protein